MNPQIHTLIRLFTLASILALLGSATDAHAKLVTVDWKPDDAPDGSAVGAIGGAAVRLTSSGCEKLALGPFTRYLDSVGADSWHLH